MQIPETIQNMIVRGGTWLNDNKPAVKSAIANVSVLYPAAAYFSGKASLFSIMGIAKMSLRLTHLVHPNICNTLYNMTAYKLSPDQLSRFGVGQTFAQNPWALKHVVSITAAAMGGVVVVDTVYRMAFAEDTQQEKWKKVNANNQPWVSDNMIRFLTAFAFFTSRPVLHVTNQLFQAYVAKKA